MAEAEKRREIPKSGEAAARATRVRWDDSKLQSTYANVVNVSSTREEVVFLFGVNQAWNQGQPEVKVDLSNRIIVTPGAAKRLHLLLGQVLGEYEKRFGALEVTRPEGGGSV
jgi:hypothetical protein